MPRPPSRRVTALAATACAATIAACAPAGPAAGPSPEAPSAAASSAASPPSPERPGPGDYDLHLTWAGKERSYALHAPPRYRPGTRPPLVVVLHYRGGDTPTMKAMTRFDAKADKEGFLVAYPVGEGGAMNALICCGDNDDVGFVRAMVDHVVTVWGADPRRLYATGISNGGDMAFRLGVELPGRFAAIAPVAGGYIGDRARADPAYLPHHPLSVVSFIGEEDSGRDRLLAGLASWRRKVHCTVGRPAAVNATVTRTAARCADGSDVVAYTIAGEGHRWPGGVQEGLGDPDAGINAVDVMWAFFAAHPRRS